MVKALIPIGFSLLVLQGVGEFCRVIVNYQTKGEGNHV
jgi:TRAP-type mannitol/chloroaromatic compound transport system permease small subunit